MSGLLDAVENIDAAKACVLGSIDLFDRRRMSASLGSLTVAKQQLRAALEVVRRREAQLIAAVNDPPCLARKAPKC